MKTFDYSKLREKYVAAILSDPVFRGLYETAAHLDTEFDCPTRWGNFDAYLDEKKHEWFGDSANMHVLNGSSYDDIVKACVKDTAQELLFEIEMHYGIETMENLTA